MKYIISQVKNGEYTKEVGWIDPGKWEMSLPVNLQEYFYNYRNGAKLRGGYSVGDKSVSTLTDVTPQKNPENFINAVLEEYTLELYGISEKK